MRCIAESVRRAKGFSDWRTYEAAKGYVRRHHPGREDYDAIIDAITTRLEV